MKPRRAAVVLVASVAFVYALVCVAARLWYPHVLFPAPRLAAVPRDVQELVDDRRAELLELPQQDGPPTRALWFPAPPGGRAVVVFHGNGETMFDRVDVAQALAARGLGALLVEYRGYGISHGPPPSEASLYADGEAAMAYLARAGFEPSRVAIWGTSLGTGVASEMARRHPVARLVLVTPFTSIPAMASRIAPILPVRLVLAHELDTLGRAPQIRAPTLVVHGDADEIIPFAMGETVAKALPDARFVRVEGAHHNDLFAPRAGEPSAAELFEVVVEHLRGG